LTQAGTHALSDQTGLLRSAALMRALGPEAQPLWERLSADEARTLSAQMDQLPLGTACEGEALDSYLTALNDEKPAPMHDSAHVWARISQTDPARLAGCLQNESPQIIAVTLSQLQPHSAASLVSMLPQKLAADALHRLLVLGPVHPDVIGVLETQLCQTLARPTPGQQDGHERLARIFDMVPSEAEQSLLDALDCEAPGTAPRIRALMFTFEDLSALDPASLQTLLSHIPRETLIIALKGASDQMRQAFLDNMTQRAGQLMQEEMASCGALRKKEIEAARMDIMTLARRLVQRGDLLCDEEDDELVE